MTIRVDEKPILVNEMFGPTFAGEGPSIGQPCVFLRSALCNQRCTWCDTAYTWDFKRFDRAKEVHPTAPDAVVKRLQELAGDSVRMLVISGGEPMLQQDRLVPVVANLGTAWWVEVETAGTVTPDPHFDPWVARYNVSPKLENSGNPLELRYRPDVLRALADSGRAVFKFVCRGPDDFPEVDALVKRVGIDAHHVYIMPEGVSTADLETHTRAIWAPSLERGWNLTTRLQIVGWGATRGI